MSAPARVTWVRRLGPIALLAVAATVGLANGAAGAPAPAVGSGGALVPVEPPVDAGPGTGAVIVPWSPTPVPDAPSDPAAPPTEGFVPAPGALDVNFSTDGIQTDTFPAAPANGAVVLPDGRVVTVSATPSSLGSVQLALFSASGRREAWSGGSGDNVVSRNFSPGPDVGYDVAVQSDGKLVVVGTASGVTMVLRFTAHGHLDTTFGDRGRVFLAAGRGFNFASSVEIDAEDRIVFAGRGGGRGGRMVVGRLTSEGDLDPTFGDAGGVLLDFTAGDDWAWDLGIEPDGHVVAVGAAEGARFAMAIARLDDSGVPDPGFDRDGRRLLSLDAGEEIGADVAVVPAGGVVVAGYSSGGGGQMAAVRVTDDGRIDRAFGTNGWAAVDFGRGVDLAWGVAIEPEGEIVLAGRAAGGKGRFAVARLSPTGGLDPSFGVGGRVTTDLTGNEDGASEVVLDSTGRALAVGGADVPFHRSRTALVRYGT